MRTRIAVHRRRAGTRLLGVTILVAFVAGCESGPRGNWLGLNAQFSGPAAVSSSPAGPSVLPPCVSLVRELNVALVRDPVMDWARLQPTADRPCDYAWPDQLVRASQDATVDLLVVFSNVPDWACGARAAEPGVPRLPDRSRAPAFADFVTRFVERYDRDGRNDMPKLAAAVRAYQFIGEMEGVPPAEYAWWLKLFHDSVKSADRGATVVLGGLSSPGLKTFDRPHGDYETYFERLLADPELAGPAYPYFDVVAFHCFPARYPGRSPFDEPLAYLRQTLAARQLNKPIWLTAFGAGSSPDTEVQQAENLVKWTVIARAAGIQRAYLHCLCDCRDPGQGPVQHCGLAREEADGRMVRKPAFDAVAKLVGVLAERPDVSFRSEGLYVLSGTGSPRYVVWKEEGVAVSQTVLRGWWSVESLNGPKTVRQASEIRLTSSPVFLERTTSPFID